MDLLKFVTLQGSGDRSIGQSDCLLKIIPRWKEMLISTVTVGIIISGHYAMGAPWIVMYLVYRRVVTPQY